MNRLDQITLGDLARALARYRPFVAVVAAIAAIAVFLPGGGATSTTNIAAGDGGSQSALGAQLGSQQAAGGPAGSPAAGLTGGTPGGSSPAAGSGTAGPAGTSPQPTDPSGGGPAPSTDDGAPPPTQAPGPQVGGVQMVANCDPATGRLRMPIKGAPYCVPAFSGDNGGATYQGVTADTIKVVVYMAQGDPASDAILAAAGADDSPEQVRQQHLDWAALWSHHLELYGRQLDVVFIEGSGPAEDDAVGKADALRVIEEQPFAVIGAPNNTFVDEVVAAGILCMCTVSQPAENYLRWAPYVWTALMSSTQGYIHRAEYIGKRLAGRNAVHAGDPLLQAQPRRFGLIYYETPDFAYKAGAEFFVRELRDKYGVELAAVSAYNGYPDIAATQEQARPVIQKMKDAGVTSIVFAGDPFAPIFFTQEATRQAYRPEWIITGSALTDTSFFARTYDQTQWANAFGISFLTARLPEELSANFRLLRWHFGRDPAAPASYGVIAPGWAILMTGIHYAGPNLNPQTFRDGQFAAPPSNVGSLTGIATSFGPQNGMWPFDDYTAADDVTEIWWDPQARGEDEIGNEGVGMYRYVDGGRRYMPTQHPMTDPKVFDTDGTVLVYDDYPDQDRPPDYPCEGCPSNGG